MKQYYFDNAATTYPKSEEVYKAMDIVNRTLAFNAGRGSYDSARQAMDIIDDTRNRLISLVKGNRSYNVIFTPSATVALNQIIFGLKWSDEEYVYVSPYEHNAIMRTLNLAKKKYNFHIVELPLKEDLSIDLDKLEFLFSQKKPSKVFISYVSNVTGYILPIEEVTFLVKKYNGITICDASQALGLIPIDLKNNDIDAMVFAGHKTLYGSFGVGGFYIKKGLQLNPYVVGGTGTDSLNLEMPQDTPMKFEAGSPNIVAIAGLRVALQEIEQDNTLLQYYKREKELTNRLVKGLKQIDIVKTYIPNSESHIGIVAFNIQNYNAADVGSILNDDYNISVRTGYHCAPIIHKYLKDEQYLGVVRASIGRYTKDEDIDYLINAVEEIAED